MGLEALSRGAGSCTFVDQDRDAIDRLRRNLCTLALNERARVVRASALFPLWLAGEQPRLVFLDPPYTLLRESTGPQRLLMLMSQLAPAVAEDGAVVLRTSKGQVLCPAEGWLPPDSHTYGTMSLHMYFRQS